MASPGPIAPSPTDSSDTRSGLMRSSRTISTGSSQSSARRCTSGRQSGAPSTITSRAGMPMMAAVQAAPRSGSASICASSITATSMMRPVLAISTVQATCRASAMMCRSSPVIRLAGTPRASSASWNSSASRRSGGERGAAFGFGQAFERVVRLAGVGRADHDP